MIKNKITASVPSENNLTSAGHGLSESDRLQYFSGGGTALNVGGLGVLEEGEYVWVHSTPTNDTFKLKSSADVNQGISVLSAGNSNQYFLKDYKDALQKISIKIDDDTHTSVDDKGTTDTSDDVTYRIHLDNSKVVASSAASYSSTTNKTTFNLPEGFNNSSAQLAVYVVPSANDDTFQGRFAEEGTDTTVNLSTFVDSGVTKVKLPGNWKTYVDTEGNTQTPANNFVLGYNYDMEIQFPTIYYTQQTGGVIKVDTNGSLVIQRVKVNFGGKGLYETTIDRVGKPSYTETWEAPLADSYDANQVAIDDFITQTIPTYERNKNLTIKLKSTHPTPATLYSMSWEGDYTTNYYQRV